MEAASVPDPAGGQPEEPMVRGSDELTLFDMGGKKPTGANITLRGGSIKLLPGTAYKKGTVVHFTGTAIINEAGQKDIEDGKTGAVVDCVQKHFARVTDLNVTPAGKPEAVQ